MKNIQYLFDSPLYVLNQKLCCMALGNRKKLMLVGNELGTILCLSIYSLSKSVIHWLFLKIIVISLSNKQKFLSDNIITNVSDMQPL